MDNVFAFPAERSARVMAAIDAIHRQYDGPIDGRTEALIYADGSLAKIELNEATAQVSFWTMQIRFFERAIEKKALLGYVSRSNAMDLAQARDMLAQWMRFQADRLGDVLAEAADEMRVRLGCAPAVPALTS